MAREVVQLLHDMNRGNSDPIITLHTYAIRKTLKVLYVDKLNRSIFAYFNSIRRIQEMLEVF